MQGKSRQSLGKDNKKRRTPFQPEHQIVGRVGGKDRRVVRGNRPSAVPGVGAKGGKGCWQCFE